MEPRLNLDGDTIEKSRSNWDGIVIPANLVAKSLDYWGYRPTIKELREEDFKNIHRVQDWRNYIHGRNQWYDLTDIERVLQYLTAWKTADREEWD